MISGTCNIKVGIAAPLSYARIGGAKAGLESGIFYQLFRSGHKQVELTIDSNVMAVPDVPLQERCIVEPVAPVTTMAHATELEEASNSPMNSPMMALLLFFLFFLYC